MKFKALNNLLLIFLYLLILFAAPSALASTSDEIKQQLHHNTDGQLIIGTVKLAVPGIVSNFYQFNDYQPAWDKAKIQVLMDNISHSDKLGLSPTDYLQTELKTRLDNLSTSDKEKAQLDILLTEALIRLVYHLKFGKVVPATLDPNWNLRRKFTSNDQVAQLHYTLSSEDKLKRLLIKASNIGLFYQGLIDALARYRKIQNEGGWQTIPDGQTIKPDMSDPRMPLIRTRLIVSGDLVKTGALDDSQSYTPALEAAVKKFQNRHSLEEDGVIGKGTLEQMNVPVERRIKQLLANLDRIRWVNDELGNEFVVVNIAGFQVYYAKDNQITWQSKVQVGTFYRKTPVFRDEISYVEFNPTWTVPPTILQKDILPKLKKDRSYLKKKNLRIIDLNGTTIDPESINWSTVTDRSFPYMIRQDPGPGNALGQVKIMFPNKHLVYLHDTPSKSKFNHAKRTFSSGCVRVQKPFELVEILLNDPQKWNQGSFKKILDGKQTQRVNLKHSVPVLLLYFTARMGENNQVYFFKDVYKRDNKVIEALKKPFKFVKPDDKS